MVNASKNVDRKRSAAGYLQRRMGNFSPSIHRRSDGRFNVIDKPIRPYYRLLCFMHWRTHADYVTFLSLGSSSIAEFGHRFAELQVACCRVS